MFIWIAVILVTIFLDQLTKYLTVLYLKPLNTFPIIEDVLHLTYAENTGAAFSMFDEPDERWIFMSISTVALVVLLAYLFLPRPRRLLEDPTWSFLQKPQGKLECLALSMIVGGGIGNMIDRFALGYVVDMIDFRLIDFAVFNVADSFVCVGAGLLVLAMVLSIIREAKEEKRLAAETENGEAGCAGEMLDGEQATAEDVSSTANTEDGDHV